jgi:hypothetical protein
MEVCPFVNPLERLEQEAKAYLARHAQAFRTHGLSVETAVARSGIRRRRLPRPPANTTSVSSR